jgi:ArsR family metal-binding transcriptional regulator
LGIDKDKSYDIIVFPNQDQGLKAQRVLVSRGMEFKHISTLAVAVPKDSLQEACRSITAERVHIIGHYPFLYRDYEEDFFKKAEAYKVSDPKGEFLKTITLCYVAPCMADVKKIRLIAYFDRDISETLPYLNAVIKGGSYNRKGSILTYVKEGVIVNLYNIKITVAKADDIIDAWVLLDEAKKLINNAYQNRDTITPSYEEKVRVTALQIYGWLPKTNCKACGETTCLAFAVKLLLGEQKLDHCIPLSAEQKYSENKRIMQEMAEALGV